MNHWERLDAAIRGERPDRIPISLWRHWPDDDQDPVKLAAATVRWQRAYDFDFVKLMPTGTYGVEDWGAQTAYVPSPVGTRTVVRFGVGDAAQWPDLAPLDPTKGSLGRQNEALERAAEELRNEVPILQTVFSPLTNARKLAGDRVFTHLRRHPELLERGLATIAETTIRFALDAIRRGGHGVFFATQCASWQLLSDDEYRRFGEKYDRQLLDAIRPAARYVLVHGHGEDAMFDLLAAYPCDLLSWHDRRVAPTLREAAARTGRALACGLDEVGTMVAGPGSKVADEVDEAVRQTGGRRLVLAPGCVCRIDTPESHYRAAVEAAKRARVD